MAVNVLKEYINDARSHERQINEILVCFYDYFVPVSTGVPRYYSMLLANSGMTVFVPFFVTLVFMYCIYRYDGT